VSRLSIYEPLGLNAKVASRFEGIRARARDPDITTMSRLLKRKKKNPLFQAYGRLIADLFVIAMEIDTSGMFCRRNF